MIHFISWESRIMKIESVKIEKIIPYELNNKIHDETQVNRIANSIREFWFLQPLVIDKNNIIIVWHGRYEASQKLWLKEIPCVRAENLTDEQIKKFRILDNKLNESAWNMENLKVELQELWNLDIWELELSVEELFPDLQFDEEEEKEIEEDESPEVEAKAKIVGGGTYLFFDSTVYCAETQQKSKTFTNLSTETKSTWSLPIRHITFDIPAWAIKERLRTIKWKTKNLLNSLKILCNTARLLMFVAVGNIPTYSNKRWRNYECHQKRWSFETK